MLNPKCRTCGERHSYGPCHQFMSKPIKASVPTVTAKPTPPLVEAKTLSPTKDKTLSTTVDKTLSLPTAKPTRAKGQFDRSAYHKDYMRNYMRAYLPKWRAARRAAQTVNEQ